MTSNVAKMERRIAGLISTYQCIVALADKTKGASPQITSRTLVLTRLELLETNWNRFKREHEILLDMNCENLADHEYFKENVEASCQQAYEDAKVGLLDIKAHYERVEPTGANLADLSAIGQGSSNFRSLPDIQLPTFEGDFHSWRSFHDLFVSMVGQNHDISSVIKMHYLRTSLRGEAAQLISNLPVSSDSFATAWDLLVARYENKRLLVTSHLDRLFGMPRVIARSAKSLNLLLNTSSEVLNALRALDQPVDQWGVILVYVIASRLDDNLREQWELKQGASTNLASLPQLREFLVARARALESIETGNASTSSSRGAKATAPSKPNNTRSPRPSTNVKAYSAQTSKPSSRKGDDELSATRKAAINSSEPLRPAGSAVQCCHYCLGQHFIASCALFRKLPPKERRTVAEKRLLCFNCLGPHSAANCRVTGRCFECNGKHHTLIHLAPNPAASTSQGVSSKPAATSSPNEPQA